MTKINNTKKTLITSVFTICFCILMFIGITFAWFTDSVSSGKNKIKAGNLDVILEYSHTLEENSWKTVTDNTANIFADIDGNDILWEPGAMSLVYLRIKNVGTLALKYNLGINIANEIAGVNAEGNNFKLSDYIQFGQIELTDNATAFTERSEVLTALTESQKISGGYTINGNMLSSEEKIIALVVYMPDDVGNEVNYLTGTEAPEIDMGITLLATQASYESDSFNKYYDSTAAYPSVSTEVVDGEPTVLKLGTIAEIIVPTDAKAGTNNIASGDVLTLSVQPETETPSGYTITSGSSTTTYDINIVNQDGVKITDENGQIMVKFYVGEGGASDVTHIVNGVATPVSFTVDGEYIIFTTDSFSPYVITSKYVAKIADIKYETLQDALDAATNGETIVLLNNITYNDCASTPLNYLAENEDISAVLDLNGKTIFASVNNSKSISLLNIGSLNANENTGTAIFTIKDSSENMSGTMLVQPTAASDGWVVGVQVIDVSRLGRLTVDSGNIIMKGGLSNEENPYGIRVITNTGAQTAELVINGGYIESKSPSGMGVHVYGGSAVGAVKFTMNGGEVVGADNGRGIWLHQAGGTGKYMLIECTINAGTIKADRALEIGDFNTDTVETDNIKVILNGGEFISTNNNNNPSHPDSSVLFTSSNPTYYNTTFSHVELTDNR